MNADLRRLDALAQAVAAGESAPLHRAWAEVVAHEGHRAAREVLRQCHLFLGFPKVVRALGILGGSIPAAEADEPPPEPRDDGLFDRLYGADAARVRGRLMQLDPVCAAWILEHAYARVLARPGLEITLRERLAILQLVRSACWAQMRSHLRNALRLGIPAGTLESDLAGLEPHAAARARAALLEEGAG